MLEKISSPEHVHLVEGSMPVRHRYTAGVAGDRFLATLRDRGEITGTPCEPCGVVYVPGRSFCERCFASLDRWVRVGPAGVLESFTRVRLDLDGNRLVDPQWIGLVRLRGATTVLAHRLTVPAGRDPRIGDAVQAVIAPRARRTGSINDIASFRLGR